LKYSLNKELRSAEIVLGQKTNINASYKDLSSVCAAIRYKPYVQALYLLEGITEGKPIEYKRHNKGMGSRPELGGKKGRTPAKCANEVRLVLINAGSNASSKGMDTESLVVVHACANKMFTASRRPPKGRQQGSPYGRYGYNTMAHSDLEFSKVEIGVSQSPEKLKFGKRTMEIIKTNRKRASPAEQLKKVLESKQKSKKQPAQKKHPEVKGEVKPKKYDKSGEEIKEAVSEPVQAPQDAKKEANVAEKEEAKR
jgi:large subunit ribosomal protein L22